MRTLLTAILALTLPMSDCAAAANTEDAPTAETSAAAAAVSESPAEGQPASTLSNYEDCDSLLSHIQGEALNHVGPYGLNALGFRAMAAEESATADAADADMATASVAAADDNAAVGANGEGGGDFSGTNVQVIGVDEPDFVKTDGRRVILVRNGTLTVVDVSGAEPEITGRVLIGERQDGEMLLHGDRVLFISNSYGTIEPLAGQASDRRGVEGEIVIIDEILLDGTPRRGRSLRVEGHYVSSRSIDGTARVVLDSYPDELGFLYPRNANGEQIALEANRKVILQSQLEDWLPDYQVVSSEGSIVAEGQILACDRVYVPAEFSGFGSLSVLSFDMSEALSLGDGAATFAQGGTVYASHHNLYVATNSWLSPETFEGEDSLREIEGQYRTSLHKFSLTSGGPAKYEASGSVKGHLLNQFSMHEYDDHLFVAVTEGSSWGSDRDSESHIFALTQQGDNLAVVGGVGDMGRGEEIHSVRYIGDRAYVVTFRQVDPLYVVDLADPTAPEVLGELKIPGYSAYLHPVGDGLLAGIGRDADDEGRLQGFKASLFDVSDPANPTEIDTWTLADAQSDVDWDHRAFLWWAPEQLMIVPVWSWEKGVPTGAAVFRVSAEAGLDYQGLITHEPKDFPFTTDCYYEFNSEALDKNWEVPLLLVCSPGEVGVPTGYNCETLAQGNTSEIDLEALGTTVGPNDRFQLCWERNPVTDKRIDRSLIIGEEIWTLSLSLLQSNDLDDLDRGNRLPLPG